MLVLRIVGHKLLDHGFCPQGCIPGKRLHQLQVFVQGDARLELKLLQKVLLLLDLLVPGRPGCKCKVSDGRGSGVQEDLLSKAGIAIAACASSSLLRLAPAKYAAGDHIEHSVPFSSTFLRFGSELGGAGGHEWAEMERGRGEMEGAREGAQNEERERRRIGSKIARQENGENTTERERERERERARERESESERQRERERERKREKERERERESESESESEHAGRREGGRGGEGRGGERGGERGRRGRGRRGREPEMVGVSEKKELLSSPA